MRWIHPLTTAALLAVPTVALAQAGGADQSGAAAQGGSAMSAPPSSGEGSYGPDPSTSSAAPATAAGGAVTAGLPVKDKNGATIGSVADVKTDASGKKVATIRMGADSFAVDTSALVVDNGAAVINATQAEIKSMLPKGQ
jgi:hypothetical protein